ncbi:hypothetical protein ACFPA8_23385 [Streptomyces ovatisporus]|uniref:DUF397 domain-containing protein n=1 Tax=Streptomyces ovatisporus TaxID=1128682 RepID=A0ABV9AAX0_9ACTN
MGYTRAHAGSPPSIRVIRGSGVPSPAGEAASPESLLAFAADGWALFVFAVEGGRLSACT